MSTVVVFHADHYEAGVCGHVAEMDGHEKFSFSHPYDQSDREFVIELVTEKWGAEHVADIDWDRVAVSTY